MLPSAVILCAGCPDTGASYEDFAERYEKINPGAGVTTGPSQCATPVADDAEVTGDYLFSLSVNIFAKLAFALRATVTAELQDDNSLLVDLSLRPLSADDQMTPVCPAAFEFTDLPVNADGSFTWTFAPDNMPLSLCGDANPVSGTEILTGLTVSGTICGGEDSNFICGAVTGKVTAPLVDHDLLGSTFTMQKIVDGVVPPPVINCDKEPAVY